MEDKLYKGIIYKYTSLENKIYIGTTINEKERRRRFSAIDAGVNRATMSKYVNGHVNSLKHTNYIWRKKYE